MHYGPYNWSKVDSGQEPFVVPNFLFSNGDMYRFSFPDVYTKEEVDRLILSINTGGGSGSSSPTYPSGEEVEY